MSRQMIAVMIAVGIIAGGLFGLLAMVRQNNKAMDVTVGSTGVKVEKIAVVEQCNVYRINEYNYVYVTICPHSDTTASSSTQNQVNCGKNCTRPQLSSTQYTRD